MAGVESAWSNLMVVMWIGRGTVSCFRNAWLVENRRSVDPTLSALSERTSTEAPTVSPAGASDLVVQKKSDEQCEA